MTAASLHPNHRPSRPEARRARGRIALAALAGMLALTTQTAWSQAASRLEKVELHPQPGEQVEVRLVLDGPAPAPVTFTIDNPARLAVDLPGTALALPCGPRSRSQSPLRFPARPAITESLERQHPSQYACQRYVHETGWLKQSKWTAQPVSIFSSAARSALAKVPPERLPRRAVRGLGAHSTHQTSPFLPTHSLEEPIFFADHF